MYKKHPEGTELDIQGITVNIPPPGVVWDHMTQKWADVEIQCRSSKKADQFFEYDELPDWYNKKRREEERIILSTGDPDFFMEDLEEVRRQWWFWRLNGRWFYNNGVPTYITGLHWFYLNCWHVGGPRPSFFDYDKKRFYHTEYCVQDPLCYGRVEVGPRRCGKTFMGGVFTYEFPSRTQFAIGGIQSKTRTDAGKVFSKGTVSQFRKLPHFFRPVYDTDSGTIPKSSIRFFHTSKKGKSISIGDYEEELESIIDYRESGLYAYDGEKVHRMLHDEIFKTVECDIYDRYKVVKECLVDNITGSVIGKYFGTSTVEEVEGKIERYEKFWDDSDPDKRDKNGHTVTGLYRYFISALETRNLDKYGNADEKKNLQIITNTVQGMSNQKDISDYKRKYPISIKDAFRPRAQDCQYNLEKLEDRYDVLSIVDEKFIRGDLRWVTPGKLSDGVKFVPVKNGNFLLHKEIDYKFGDWNQVSITGNKVRPTNGARFVAGNDSFDHKKTEDGRKSNGSTAVFYKYDSMNPLNSDKFVLLYCYRPKTPSIFREDTLKICWFFGAKMLPETNKPGLVGYFEGDNPFGMDFSEFLITLPGRNSPGIPGTTQSIGEIMDHTTEYIEDCIDLVDYSDLITDWIKFNPDNTTKFDLGMASGYALIAANRKKADKVVKEAEFVDISDVFRTYKR